MAAAAQRLEQDESSNTGLVLLSDRPVAEDGQTDLLDRGGEAAALAELVRASRAAAPFTLAVYADWGMGKSSLLSQMAAHLKAAGDIEVVWFNAWNTRSGQGLEALVKVVLNKLDAPSIRRLAREVSGHRAAAAWLRVLLSAFARTVALHHLVDGIWEQLSVDARTRNEAKDLLRSTLAAWTGSDAAGKPRRMLVVVVDDLDRCAPETIRTVSAAIKQYLNVPGLVFVLACDQSVLEATAQDSAVPGQGATGRRFLEKVIQASYSIPAPTDAQVAALVSGYARDAGAETLFQGAVGKAVVEHVGRNPRRIKRLINRFVIEYHLDPEWQRLGAEALVRVALLQDFYPDFYRLLALTGELDPIEAFGGYLSVMRAQRQGFSASNDVKARALETLTAVGIPDADRMSEISKDTIGELERNLPEQFPPLARDTTFVSLVEYLVNLPAGEQLRLKLRGGNTLSSPRSMLDEDDPDTASGFDRRPVTAPSAISSTVLPGLKILRLTARPVTDGGSLELSQRGADVTWVSTVEAALEHIRRERPEVVMTNLWRPGVGDGGFDDIEVLRQSGYLGPIIIYTGFVSPVRRDRAERLGVLITADPEQALRWLSTVERATAILADRRPAQDMKGLRVLWLTPEIDLPARRNFESRGALITTASTAQDAAAAARRNPPDVLVIEGWRSASEGVDLARRTALYHGPAIVWTSRVTPQSRDLAEELAVEITDDAADLAEFLVRVSEQSREYGQGGENGIGPREPRRVADHVLAQYDQLARNAQQLADSGDFDRAEQQWDSAGYLSQSNDDLPGALRAMVMKAAIALHKRRYSLAISRYRYAIARGAAGCLSEELVAQIYRDLERAYSALGDQARADEAQRMLSERP